MLRDYFTDVELMDIIVGQVFNNDANGNGIRTAYPENSVHRFEIQSVTFSETNPDVAWLETCWVDDGLDHYIRSGQVADVHMSILETPPIRTVQRTEEMRRENGLWKVARDFINSYQEGVAGCATQDGDHHDYAAQDVTDELRQTITDSRTAAEAAYVAYLTDPSYAGYADTWTGFQHDLYFANPPSGSGDHRNPDDHYCPGDVTLIETGGWFSGEYEQWYLQDDSLNPWRTNPYYQYATTRVDQSPCYNDYTLGQNAWTYYARNDGHTFDPATTTSTVVVTSIQLQAVDRPHVAYLTTCRTYNLAPTWQGDFQHLQGTVSTVETMHVVDDMWRVSNRWQFTGTGACT